MPSLRLLAIDPSLAATGFLTATVEGVGRMTFQSAGTVTTPPDEPMAERLVQLVRATREWVDLARGPHGASLAVVVEDPTNVGGMPARWKGANLVAAAFGVIVGQVLADLGSEAVLLVPMQQYYPKVRTKGNLLRNARHKDAAAEGRRLLPPDLSKASEHVAMCALLARWWTHSPACLRRFAVRRS